MSVIHAALIVLVALSASQAQAQDTPVQPPNPSTLQVPQGYGGYGNSPLIYPSSPPATPTPYGDVRSPAPQFVGSPALTARLRLLDESLQNLGYMTSPVVRGTGSLIVGGLSIGLGAYMRDDDPAAFAALTGVGCLAIASGVITLVFAPDASGVADKFARMSRSTPSEAREALSFGEHALEDLASRARVERYLDASLDVVGSITLVFAYRLSRGGESFEPYDMLIYASAAASVFRGLFNFFLDSPHERHWRNYRARRESSPIDERQAERRDRVRPGIAASSTSATILMQGTF